jgi:acetyltransferase-like isoleucine patch superfamily enzyme
MYDFNNKKPRTNNFISTIDVEDYVIIGPSCVVLPGVVVGTSASVGANSFVKSSVNANSVVAGNPCKLIRVKK